MKFCKSVIQSYYSNLINEIDIRAESILSKNSDKIDLINSTRQKFINTIKTCEKINYESLDLVKKEESDEPELETIFRQKFCFYIETEESIDECLLGSLIIVGNYVPQCVREKLSIRIYDDSDSEHNFFFSCPDCDGNDDDEDDEEHTHSYLENKFEYAFVYEYLKEAIEMNMNETNLIDLTLQDSKSLDNMTLYFRTAKEIEKNPLEKIPEYIKIQDLKKLSLVLNECDEIEPTLFSKLANLETLYIYMKSYDFQENTIRNHLCCDNFSGLQNLKELRIKGFAKFDIDQNTFRYLKNLQVLDLFDNWIEEICCENKFDGLDKLKYLTLSCQSMCRKISLPSFQHLEYLDITPKFNHALPSLDLDELELPNLRYLRFKCHEMPDLRKFRKLQALDLFLLEEVEVDSIELIFLDTLDYLNISAWDESIINEIKTENLMFLGSNFKVFTLNLISPEDEIFEKLKAKKNLLKPLFKKSDPNVKIKTGKDKKGNFVLMGSLVDKKKMYVEKYLDASEVTKQAFYDIFNEDSDYTKIFVSDD
ncbi:unnamed protein product [Brachionus calyciflorus]|uniref:Uncharacterized protein n=1 Tax=Brachionus calyciflorus TaxID=104777 RepID=A0A814K5F2_9BILA|nr:unnamed protein product [Brachionus calyciflorus]